MTLPPLSLKTASDRFEKQQLKKGAHSLVGTDLDSSGHGGNFQGLVYLVTEF